MSHDPDRLAAFMDHAVQDLGAAMSTALCLLGERLGLYKALAKGGPMTASELAGQTGTTERYVREWLMNQAAGGYVSFDAASGLFTLPAEQALALADEQSPVYLHGAFDIVTAVIKDIDKVEHAFRSGGGIDWGDHDPALFCGTERFFRPGYNAHLLSAWLPALDGVEAKLRAGALVADVGCGHGASAIILARAFPRSRFIGFDAHAPSIAAARRAAEAAGVTSNLSFETARSTDYPGRGYDLVAFFDCLHDMGDPAGAARHVHETLKPDGTLMVVEPFAHDAPEKNLNPLGRVFYAASTTICVPASLAHDGPALGTQAGESHLRSVLMEGGFRRIRRAAETPFNMVLEARA